MSSYYNNEDREDYHQYVDPQIESEQMFDDNIEICEEVLFEMRETINGSFNPFLLMHCAPTDLMRLIDSGKHKLPKYLQQEPEKTSEELLYIPEPISYLDIESTDMTTDWVTLKSAKEMRKEKTEQQEKLDEEAKKLKAEELKQQEKLAVEKARAITEVNKFNWTMTKEMRGIKPKPVVAEKPKTQKRKRRRRGGFKVNKSNVTIM